MKARLSCLLGLMVLFVAVTVRAEQPLPAAMRELPRYPGSTVTSTMEMGPTVNTMFEATATQAEIVDFFNKQLPGQGWSKTMEAQQADGAIVNFVKGQASLALGVDPPLAGGKITYTLIVTKGQ